MAFITNQASSFRWLFAELLVIVLGILVAFQVEEWRQYRQDRVTELEMLESIHRDVQGVLRQYSELVETFSISINASNRLVMGIQAGDLSEEEIVEASRDVMSAYSLSNASLSFDGYLQSGKLSLIRDKELERDCRNFFGFLRTWMYDLNVAHNQFLYERVNDDLRYDVLLVPERDYPQSGAARGQLSVPLPDFPTSKHLQDRLIELNGRKAWLLSRLEITVSEGESISLRIRDQLSGN